MENGSIGLLGKLVPPRSGPWCTWRGPGWWERRGGGSRDGDIASLVCCGPLNWSCALCFRPFPTGRVSLSWSPRVYSLPSKPPAAAYFTDRPRKLRPALTLRRGPWITRDSGAHSCTDLAAGLAQSLKTQRPRSPGILKHTVGAQLIWSFGVFFVLSF